MVSVFSLVAVCRLFVLGLLLLRSMGSWVQELWHTSLVATHHVGFPQTRDRTRIPCRFLTSRALEKPLRRASVS